MTKTQFIIVASHGEYDDHVETPVIITPDRASAELICEALDKRDPEFTKYLPSDWESWFPDFSSGYYEIPFVNI